MAEALSVVPRADQYLRSVWWWRRALALRVFGLLQVRDRTARLIAALDDPHPDVRAAALDALTDLRDPASLQAVLVRMHDSSLHRGRRAAAVAAFGRACEPFLLDLAAIDRTRRANYARALAVCGTEASRPALREWARDRNPLVRAAAFEALGRVGLDEAAAQLALDGLDDIEDVVRRAAVRALRGWRGGSESVGRLALHLTDSWTVAVAAAECLRSMGAPGLAALKVSAERPDLAGVLARQMLWEDERVR
jgi:HEAT repeat protein